MSRRSGEGWTPAFPGQRPPFPVTHGAYSPKRVDPVASGLVHDLLADEEVAYLRAGYFLPAIWAWARAEARVLLLTEWLADRPPTEGKPMPALEQLRQWESTAAAARTRLGLDPTSRAKLLKDLAVTSAMGGNRSGLESLAERGRQARMAADGRDALDSLEGKT